MTRRVNVIMAAAFGLAAALLPLEASAYCPSYTASSASNQYGCAIEAVNGTNPSTEEWNAIFDLVAQGPAVWGDKGPSVGDIGQGCGKPEPLHEVPARFPCELLKGIASQESGWRQFCVPDDPGDQVGGPSRTIISFDCGYGIGQVTSGMHFGENPGFDRERVAADPTYNLATGTRILASKWIATNCVGDNQPTVVEHWYIATWAYNGLAYVNNPNNPNYDPNRGVWDPSIGGGAPYQEKVYGWMEHPLFQGVAAIAPAYPNPGEIGGGSTPPELSDPDCASPTDCGNKRSLTKTACDGSVGTGGSGGQGGSAGAGGSGGQGGSAQGGSAQGGSAQGGGGSAGAGVGGSASGGSDGSGSGGEGGEQVSCKCGTAQGAPGAGTTAMIGLLTVWAMRRRRPAAIKRR
jgi:MYXO-CTERM domain-containing protein